MRPETRQRLDAALARERWKRLGVAVAVVAVIAGAFLFADWRQRRAAEDHVVRESHLPGTVTTWHFVGQRQTGAGHVIALRVKLDDGREVDAGSTTHQSAKVGERVDLLERAYASGRTTHVWE